MNHPVKTRAGASIHESPSSN